MTTAPTIMPATTMSDLLFLIATILIIIGAIIMLGSLIAGIIGAIASTDKTLKAMFILLLAGALLWVIGFGVLITGFFLQ